MEGFAGYECRRKFQEGSGLGVHGQIRMFLHDKASDLILQPLLECPAPDDPGLNLKCLAAS